MVDGCRTSRNKGEEKEGWECDSGRRKEDEIFMASCERKHEIASSYLWLL